MDETLENLKYPIGRFDWSRQVSKEDRIKAIQTIAAFPAKMRDAVKSLNDSQLNTPYRPDGWTIRQVVHHCPDSHMNAYIRFKLALTENSPTIKPYDQAEWAKLPDSKLDPETSLQLIESVHKRWVAIMENMTDEEWELGWIHPDHNAFQAMKQVVTLYGWHCEHHFSHIDRLKKRMGW